MTHLKTVREEFARQAESFAASSTLSAPDITERVAAALGDVSGQRVLDVACGPGILTDAITSRGRSVVVLDILTSRDAEVSDLHNAIERLRDPSHTTFLSDSRLRDAIADAGFDDIAIDTWERSRQFSDWAAIINEPTRMAALETLLRHLARTGESAGIRLREEDGEVWFTYRWGLLVATAA